MTMFNPAEQPFAQKASPFSKLSDLAIAFTLDRLKDNPAEQLDFLADYRKGDLRCWDDFRQYVDDHAAGTVEGRT